MKIYDTFLFNNELDLLEIRLNILENHVDYFVLVEAKETFTGLSKPLHYLENKDRFEKWNHKIIHFVVDNDDNDLWYFSKNSPNVGAGEHFWVREFYQKENILKAFHADENDIIFVSDLDEIWNPDSVNPNLLDFSNNNVYRPIQTAYHYYLNNRSDQNIHGWVGTRVGKFSTLKNFGVNHFRTERFIRSIPIQDGGWHFTNIGNSEFIKQKLNAYSHQEYNREDVVESIEESINKNIDFLNRGFKLWKDESELPIFLKENKNIYIKLFL